MSLSSRGLKPFSIDGIFSAVQRVNGRLQRAVMALESADVPYAVIGAHAVAAWVATVDPGGIRNTPNVDLLIRRTDAPAAVSGLSAAGFVPRSKLKGLLFLDGPNGRERPGLQLFFSSERGCASDQLAMPDVSAAEPVGRYRVIGLFDLVTMKLALHRTIDRVHIRDMIEVGLIDASWLSRFPPDLAARLQEILDTPNG